PEFGNDVPFEAYAIEVSHHVRGKVLGVGSEGAENVVLVAPRAAAQRMISASDQAAVQGALLESEVYLNGDRVMLWLSDDLKASNASLLEARLALGTPAASVSAAAAQPSTPDQAPAGEPHTAPPALHDASLQSLERLHRTYEDALARMAAELSSQAGWVDYAPPVFISFHEGAYLQLTVKTQLPQDSVNGSQYRLAALAFDSHLAHLIRPVLAHLPSATDFDGIDFSTTVLPGTDRATAVELIIPMALLRRYESFDCTGQQLINGSFVLINGERVSLDLQSAEGDRSK
ncbi:MAG: hypothetical protein JO041_09060, partial [Acidobacteria bacterium]|nr:hypothetical protein [Acidobacteriota bacterium]